MRALSPQKPNGPRNDIEANERTQPPETYTAPNPVSPTSPWRSGRAASNALGEHGSVWDEDSRALSTETSVRPSKRHALGILDILRTFSGRPGADVLRPTTSRDFSRSQQCVVQRTASKQVQIWYHEPSMSSLGRLLGHPRGRRSWPEIPNSSKSAEPSMT
eukprot:9488702-Pyramimonas_sp.AAC.1